MAYDRAGSISLKSSLPMDYSRAVLSNKWHQKREAEPIDNPLWSGNRPNLHQSTYKMLQKNIPCTKTSSETETKCNHEEALRFGQENQNQDPSRPIVDEKNQDRLNQNLSSYSYKNIVIPSHAEGHDKHHLETTYHKDFVNHHPEFINQKSSKAQQAEFEKMVDNSFVFRRMVSQFSDIDAPKRDGINTFHVQHGEYPNQKMKNEVYARMQNKLFY